MVLPLHLKSLASKGQTNKIDIPVTILQPKAAEAGASKGSGIPQLGLVTVSSTV